jgi:hypothetical protein
MALFYFDVTDDGDEPRSPDDIGTEHPSKECIPAEAADLLTNVARDRLPDGAHRTFSVSVRDDEGRVVYKATLSLQAGWQ